MVRGKGRTLGLVVAGTAITAAVAVPTWVAAAGQSDDHWWKPDHVAQDATSTENFAFDSLGMFGPLEFAATDGLGFIAGEAGVIELGEAGGFHRFPRLHHWGMPFVTRDVMEQFDIDPEELRAAMESVQEQFPSEERPEFSIPPTEEEQAAIEAYRAERLAALATALGIPVDEFQAAIDAALEEQRAKFEERRAEMEERRNAYQAALAEALGITVEELDAAIEQAREAVGGDEMGAVPALRAEPIF